MHNTINTKEFCYLLGLCSGLFSDFSKQTKNKLISIHNLLEFGHLFMPKLSQNGPG